jgi:hypothetical protein
LRLQRCLCASINKNDKSLLAHAVSLYRVYRLRHSSEAVAKLLLASRLAVAKEGSRELPCC